MEFPSTRGTCHGYLVDRCTDHSASPAHAARHADAWSGLRIPSRTTFVTSGASPRSLGARPTLRRPRTCVDFQLHQHESGVGPATINSTVSALRFLFHVTLKRRDLARGLVIMRYPRKLPEVLSVEEAARLLEAAPGIKYKAALGVAYGAGLRVSGGRAPQGRRRRQRRAC